MIGLLILVAVHSISAFLVLRYINKKFPSKDREDEWKHFDPWKDEWYN